MKGTLFLAARKNWYRMIVPRLASRHSVTAEKLTGLSFKRYSNLWREMDNESGENRATGRCLILQRRYAPVDMG
jgi:hypothetical protein